MTIQTLIKYFFAFLIIIFTIWNRFIRERGHATINVIPLFIIIILKICLIIFFGMLFYINLKTILKIQRKSIYIQNILSKPLILKIRYWIQEYILNAPEFLYNDFTKNFNLAPLLEMPGSYFTAYCNYPRIIVILCLQLPLIIVSSCFLMDILFFDNLKHFFSSLTLLIPLLLMKLWIFVLFSYSKRRLDYLSQFLNINYLENRKQFILRLKPDHELPILNNFTIFQIKEKFIVMRNFWEIYSQIYSFMQHIYTIRDHSSSYIQLYTSFCFSIGWIIQLCHII